MSFEFLLDLERDIELGKEVYGCPSTGLKQWSFSNKGIEPLLKVAKRTANSTKMPVNIMRLDSRHGVNALVLLVPVQIGDPGLRGEPQIKWSIVESKEAAETVRDIRSGPSPYFAVEVEQTINPDVV
jgi:hypothetical protein